jgi:hypothetical protein
MSDLTKAFDALSAKKRHYDKLYQYYDGDQPLMYLASRLNAIFKGLDAYFAENWCSVVINAPKERIAFKRWETGNAALQKILDKVYEENQFETDIDDVAEAMMITSEGFQIAWPDGDDMEVYYNDPRMVQVFYDPEKPRQIKYAAKKWTNEKGYTRITLYYADQIERYVSTGKDPENGTQFRLLEKGIVTHDYGRVPVFHYRLNKRGISDLKDVIPLQNGINKLLNDMMVASEFSSFRQRFIISQGEIKGKLSSEPGALWEIPAGDGIGQQTQVGEFAATELQNYIKGIDRFASSIGVLSRTPKHFFYQQGGDPSGEALIAMEAPLNKKTQDRIDRMVPVLKDIAMFTAQVNGIEVERSDIRVVFEKPETIQPLTLAQVIQTEVTSGIPLQTSLRWRGRTDAEIKKVLEEVQAVEDARAKSLADAMLKKQREFDGENQDGMS